jgi:hypothetical protein
MRVHERNAVQHELEGRVRTVLGLNAVWA